VANANALRSCPRCGAEVSLPTLAVCENQLCRHKLIRPTNTHFKDPDYLSRQMRRYKASYEQSIRSKHSSDDRKEYSLVNSDYLLWAREAPMDSRLAAIEDATIMLRFVMHADMSEGAFIPDLQALLTTAKSLGKLAETIQTYFAQGGSSSDDPFLRSIEQEKLKLSQARGIS